MLPAFDEHLLGYQDRSAALDAARADSICPGGNGVFRPTLVVKGRVAGLWTKKASAMKLTIEVMSYEPLSSTTRRDAGNAGQRLGRFYGKPVAVDFIGFRRDRPARIRPSPIYSPPATWKYIDCSATFPGPVKRFQQICPALAKSPVESRWNMVCIV